jgi:cytochrome P450
VGEGLLGTVGRDPFPYYEELRRRCPVSWDDGLGGWLLTDWADCVAASRSDEEYPLPWPSLPGAAEIQGARSLAMLSGREHRRLHNALLGMWTRVAADERVRAEIVRPVLHAAIDRFEPRGRAELAGEFADRVHLPVVAALLGLPPLPDGVLHEWAGWMDDMGRWMEMLRRGIREDRLDEPWEDAVGGWSGTCREVLERGRAGAASASELIRPYVRARRDDPHDDVTSAVWALGRALFDDWGEQDVVEHCRGFADTTFTTGTFLCNALSLLLAHEELLARVRADPDGLLPHFVEEALRLLPPVHVRARVAAHDGELGGVAVPAGDPVFPLSAAANRDPARYRSPAETDLERPNPRDHHAFSVGPHFCIGAPLVRMEGVEALGALLERLPGLRPDGDAPPPRMSGFNLRPVRPLHVRFGTGA